MSGRIRLGCIRCYRDDFDGVDAIPADWSDVSEERSFERSCAEVPPGKSYNEYGDALLDWQTHLGLCPDCRRRGGE